MAKFKHRILEYRGGIVSTYVSKSLRGGYNVFLMDNETNGHLFDDHVLGVSWKKAYRTFRSNVRYDARLQNLEAQDVDRSIFHHASI